MTPGCGAVRYAIALWYLAPSDAPPERDEAQRTEAPREDEAVERCVRETCIRAMDMEAESRDERTSATTVIAMLETK